MILDALTDTVRLVPLLALVYFLVGFLEYRFGDRMGGMVARLGAMGPIAGAAFGCIPQCGFSVVAAALYARRLVSLGTLLAVFVSTSDEAVPVLLSIPSKAGIVGSLIAIKVVVAIIAGIVIDLVIRRDRAVTSAVTDGADAPSSHEAEDHSGCCSHGLHGKGSKVRALVLHPLIHTAKIFVFLFVLAAIFNFAVTAMGPAMIAAVLMRGTLFQPVLTAFIGLVPSCFTSVLLAGLFVKGVINFGSLVAGLSAGCGLGLLVLIKENKDWKDNLLVVGLLLAVSISAGIIISALRGLA